MASTHPRCHRCERKTTDAATLCHECTRALKGALTHIARLWPNLLEAIGKRTAMGARSGHKPTKPSEHPLPINTHASTVADRTKGVLVGWCRVLCDDHRLTPPDDTAPAIALWLRANAHLLRMHEAAAEACDEITWASGDVTRAVDLPKERAVHPAGPCPEIVDDVPCSGTVKAHVPADSDRVWFDCEKCGAEWDSTQLNRLGDRISARKAQIKRQKAWGAKPVKPEPKPEPRLAGLNVTAVQYGIPLGTMRRWLADGVLIRYGDGKPWLVDTLEVERLRATRRIAG